MYCCCKLASLKYCVLLLLTTCQPTWGRPALFDAASGTSGHQGELPQLLGALGQGFWNKALFSYLERARAAGQASNNTASKLAPLPSPVQTLLSQNPAIRESSGLSGQYARVPQKPAEGTAEIAGADGGTTGPGIRVTPAPSADRLSKVGSSNWAALAREAADIEDLQSKIVAGKAGDLGTAPAVGIQSSFLGRPDLMQDTSYALEGATAGVLKLAGWQGRLPAALVRGPPSPAPVPPAPMGLLTNAVVRVLNTSGVLGVTRIVDPLQLYNRYVNKASLGLFHGSFPPGSHSLCTIDAVFGCSEGFFRVSAEAISFGP